ncbi:hypothetical protein MVES1_002620 [Malassezia vespertilionis]|uniref:Uncharacterized protein n=1 Tax=Malassezia vespertilionis TaxID=2020962 RepID=A0A2N1JAG8_9BASI|nr:uncharacterized protein MVES1_002620 [Malassezia vespertilionis]PKI83550.1 hypothetical protein MVES_002474 [Malassezia vespertilionis]WFD07260.1 hypothetical protein MVES1_002620 [Malassezia vespertilionis]
MAHRSNFGTEQDKDNCSFYLKIGACRHGERCSRKHIHPISSRTILLSNVYQNPRHTDPQCPLSDEELQQQFDDFYTDFFAELCLYGELCEMHVCDNVGDHLIGNVYARYETEEDAQRAVDRLNNRWFNERPLFAELSPVSDFREARCRQNETNECNRGGLCNFMHLRLPSPALARELNHQLAVENRAQRLERQARNDFYRLGWKDRNAALEADASRFHADLGANLNAPDWRNGPSGGDWHTEATPA